MKKSIVLVSVFALIANPAFAKTKSQVSKIKAEDAGVSDVKFESAFETTVGTDSNIYPSKDGHDGTFYQLAPSLGISGKMFSTKAGAKLKDFSDQQLSTNARNMEGNLGFGLDTKLIGNTTSKTNLDILYHSERRPDSSGHTGNGVDRRWVETKATQNLSWDMKQMNVGLTGSAAQRDYSTKHNDGAEQIYNSQYFENDYRELLAAARVGVKMNQNIEMAATPQVKQTTYDNNPALQTPGFAGGASANDGNLELLESQITAELKLNVGPVELVPSIVSGVQADQVNGAEDTSFSGGGLTSSIMFHKKTDFKLTAGATFKNIKYDNWVFNVVGGGKRDEDESSINIGASFNALKNLNIGVSYAQTKEVSNLYDASENYTQEVIGTVLTLKF